MITRRLLFNTGKIVCIASLAWLCLFVACKTKQNAVSSRSIKAGTRASADKEAELSYLFVTGCTERMKGNTENAQKIFLECYALAPNNPAISYELGMLNKLAGRNNEALMYARQAAAADKKNQWYQLLLVECYNSINEYGKAIKVREGLIKNFPDNFAFKEELAYDYALAGQYERSLKLFNELENVYGINEQVTLNKVKLYKSMKRNPDAEAELKKLADSDNNETRYKLYLTNFYTETGEAEKAKAVYDKIIESDSLNAPVNLALYDYYKNKGDEKQAYNCLLKAFRNPDLDVNTKTGITGNFYLQAERGDRDALIKGSELAAITAQLHPKNSGANSVYADFLRLENNIELSAKYYYKASLGEKRNYRVWSNLMAIDNQLRRTDSLEKHSAACMELFPSLPEGYLFNGIANTQLKNYKKAVSSLSDGLEFATDKNLRFEFYRLLGDANYFAGNHASSDRAYDEALKIDPDNAYVLNNYAYFLSLRKTQLAKAEKYALRANTLFPNTRSYQDTYGWVLYMLKKYAEAEKWLEKAVAGGPPDPEIYEHYGDVLYKLERSSEALEYWKKAKGAGGQSEALDKKIKSGKTDE